MMITVYPTVSSTSPDSDDGYTVLDPEYVNANHIAHILKDSRIYGRWIIVMTSGTEIYVDQSEVRRIMDVLGTQECRDGKDKFCIVGFGSHPKLAENARTNYWAVNFDNTAMRRHDINIYPTKKEAVDMALIFDAEDRASGIQSVNYCVLVAETYWKIVSDKTMYYSMTKQGIDEDMADELDDERIINELKNHAVSAV